MKIEIEIGGELLFAQMLAHLAVGLEQRQEIAFAAPGLHGIALDEGIGLSLIHILQTGTP